MSVEPQHQHQLFPEWLKVVSFAGRKTKVYTEAQEVLKEQKVAVTNWSGSIKGGTAPDAVLLDRWVSNNPPKKVTSARAAHIPTIDVEWVIKTRDTGRHVDHRDYELSASATSSPESSGASPPDDSSDSDVIAHARRSVAAPPSAGGLLTGRKTATRATRRKRKTRAAAPDTSDEDAMSATGRAVHPSVWPAGKRHPTRGASATDISDDDLTGRCAAQGDEGHAPQQPASRAWWERSGSATDRAPWVGVGPTEAHNPPGPARGGAASGQATPAQSAHARGAEACQRRGSSALSSLFGRRCRRRGVPGGRDDDAGHHAGIPSPPSKVPARKSIGGGVGRGGGGGGGGTACSAPSAQPMPRPSTAAGHPPTKRQRVGGGSSGSSGGGGGGVGGVAKGGNLVDKAAEKRRGRGDYDKPWLSGVKKAEPDEPPQDPVMKQLLQHEATRHIPQEILAGIRHQILDSAQLQQEGVGVTFDQVHGLGEAKKTLHRSVILPRQNPKLFTGLRKPAKGLLLFGPPGNGKTMLAKAVAAQCKLTFFNISASVLTSKMVGDGEKNVRALFACARVLAPSFVFLDEIDSLLTSRGGGGNEHEASRRVKTEFLVQLDGAGACNDNVLFMAATNRPMDLDDAVLRRLEKRVYVPLPDRTTRMEYCRRVLEKDNDLRVDFTDETWGKLADATEDYSFSDLANLCRELALAPLDDVTNLMDADVQDLRPVNAADVTRQTQKIRKSVSDELLRQLLKWNDVCTLTNGIALQPTACQ